MYKLINDRIEDIVKAFADPKEGNSLKKYNRLCTELGKRNVANSEEYQRIFRGFWRMRCGQKYARAFFRLLERKKNESDVDSIEVVHALRRFPTRGGKQTLEFSFATKLAHMVDHHLPIYDSMVRKFYFLPDANTSNFAERLDYCSSIYRFLKAEYKRILNEKVLDTAIRRFRKALDLANSHTDEKIIDWLIWKFVDLADKKKWFLVGLCRYE